MGHREDVTSALKDLIEVVENEKVYDYGMVLSSIPGRLGVLWEVGKSN